MVKQGEHILRSLILIITATIVALPVSAKDIPIESDFKTNGEQSQAQAAASIVKASGYRCDSIAAFTISPQSMFGGGVKYTIYCNGYQYGYSIVDKGGRPEVTVE